MIGTTIIQCKVILNNPYKQLEVLPDRWRNVTRLCTVMKNTIAPLQATQAGLIAKRVALVNLRINMYRDQFKDKEVNMI